MADKPTSPPPAYFLSLSLENVRSFGKKQTIYFTENGDKDSRPAKWTIILGDNGVGKTTVLKSLAAMVTEDRPIDMQDPYGIAAMWRLANSVWLPFRYGNTRPAQLDTMVVQDRQLEIGEFGQDANIIQAHIGKTNGGGMMSRGHNPRGLICYGYGAGRTSGNSTLSDSPETIDTCSSLFNDRADLLNPEEWFLNIDYGIRLLAEDKRKQLSDANDRVRQMLKDVLPGVTDLRIENSGTPQKPQISLQFLLYGTWVRLRDMSLGYQTLIVWLTDLASKLFVRYPESDNPLAEPAIVLIDEIDLHLHPQWQRELLGMLSKIFVNTQFIATAHSPLVVQAAGDEGANLVLLKREGDQTIVVPDLPAIERWRIDQILNSELFDNVSAHSVDTEKQLRRRDALLAKARLTAKEREELDGLNRFAHGQPVDESSDERRAADVLRELARKLGKQELLD